MPFYREHLAELDKRLSAALQATGYDKLVVFAGSPTVISRDDQTYPFRVEPYFAQWVPLANAPGSVLELAPGQRPRLQFLIEEGFWEEPAVVPEDYWCAQIEVDAVRQIDVRGIAAGKGRVAAIGDAGSATAQFASVNDPALLSFLDYFRAYKTRHEVQCLRTATVAAVRGHRAVEEAFAAGLSEFGIAQAFCSGVGQDETELPYRSIVALNEHASILHYQNRRRQAPDRLLSLLTDAGASYGSYGSDITRCQSSDDEFSSLIEAVDALQRGLCAKALPGVDFVDLNESAHQALAQLMHAHGLARCSADEAYASGLTRIFLPHGLGHLLGLQVHDAGGRQVATDGHLRPPPAAHPFLRLTRTLEPGFVLTIEPGLYFIPQLLAKLTAADWKRLDRPTIERLREFGGIRIEDNLLVESRGAINLTREAFGKAA